MAVTCKRRDAKSSFWTVLFSVIFWLVCLFTAATAEEPVGQSSMVQPKKCMITYKIYGVKASCSNMSLTSIPHDPPPDTITLIMDNNLIVHLKNNSFDNLTQLATLNIRLNLISKLDTGAFSPLTRLEILDLTGNMLTQLPDGLFDSNSFLSRLVLTSNCFKTVPSNTLMTHLDQLRYLSLGRNAIMEVNFTAFQFLKNLSVIDFSGNNIASLRPSDFEHLHKLSLNSINLASNELSGEKLPDRIFSFLNQVVSLNLYGNQLRVFRLNPFLGNVTISILSLSNCGIFLFEPFNSSTLPTETLPTIYDIDMKQNSIDSIPSNAFQGLNQTMSLNLAENKIKYMTNQTFCGMNSLVILDLSKNRIENFTNGIFLCTPRLQILTVAYNDILVLSPRIFQRLSVLHRLDLSHNAMRYVFPGNWNNSGLQILDMSHNLFEKTYRTLFRGWLPNLKVLDMSFNLIETFYANTFDNVPSLREIYLGNMLTSVITLNGVFNHTKNLVKLSISSTRITSLRPSHQFTGSVSLEELSMCENDMGIENLFNSATNSSLFKGLTSLRKLTLRENHLMHIVPGVFRPLIALLSLDLSNSKIETLEPGSFRGLTSLKSLYLNDNCIKRISADTFSGLGNLVSLFLRKSKIVALEPGSFQGLASLRSIYLSDNRITSISTNTLSGLDNLISLYIKNNLLRFLDKRIFAATPNLHILSLSNNVIRTVQKDTFFPKSNITFIIDISGNPLSCNCELSWFRTWLNEHTTTIHHLQETVCSKGSFETVFGKPILEFDPTYVCGFNTIPITSLTLFTCIVIYLSLLVYHKRSWLRIKFVFLKQAIRGSGRIVENFKDENYDFHLNIMFHDGEEEWLDRVMKPVLAERFPNIKKIIYGDGELRREMFYINAIYDAIENSFKTVLLISNRSLRDIWCITKFRLAVEHVSDTGLDKFILIFIEDIEEDDMPSLIQVFLSENKPHMWWTRDEDEQEMFWAQFHRSMKANRAVINAIPLYL
ncbi:toll-like receptor 3 [Lytechinus variegatus]|uniref:toll-like receptor 3 n=1 Tax=Lytechinus variegatus TaxID=7654 RepID=UPI001BB10405|nr:toll-like receptor 3 [Lytechinus variegatus]